MLTKEALQEAVALTESFDQKDIALEPIPDTPLEALVRQTVVLPSEGEIDYDATTAASQSVEKISQGSEHDLTMDECVKVGAESVRRQIAYAKNVVRPMTMEYIRLVEEDIAAMPTSGLAKYEIKQFNLPELFSSDSFRQSLEMYADTPYVEYRFNLKLPDLLEQDLIDIVHVGSTDMDQYVDEMIARVGIDFVYMVYNYVFQTKQESATDLRDLMVDKKSGNDFTTICYLIANKLYNNPPENTENSLEEYNNSILTVRNQTGNRLYRIAKEYETAYENGKLVKSIPTTYSIEVYPHVYSEWIEEGGDNTVLLGSLLAENSTYTVQGLKDNSENFKSLWEKNKQVEEKVAFNNRFVYIKESLKNNFVKLMNEDESTPAEKTTYFKILEGELNLVSASDLTDVCSVCLKLICRARFYRSDAERILGSMDRISKENPSMNPREAALISAIELATDWACAQLTPVSTI